MSKKFTYIVEFDSKSGNFIRSMRSNVSEVKRVDKSIESAKKTALGAQATFKRLGGILGVAFAGKTILNFIGNAERAYDIQDKAERSLLVALNNRHAVQQRLIFQAQQLQKKTLFGDEETIKAQALIAAFVKEGDQIERVIPLVQDLASAKNMDLAAAADLVSKTLGSSTNALARYGIQVEGSVGSVERLESLVKSLNDAFGGQAEEAAKAGIGAVKQMKNAWGDFLETVGEGGSGVINSNAKFITALLQAMTGGMKKSMEENKSDAEKFQDELTASTDKGLADLRQSWNKQATYYRKLWKDAMDSGDDASRAHYATQFDLSKQMIDQIDAEIKKRKGEVPVITSVADRIKGLKDELAIAQKNASNTNNIDLFLKGQKDVADLTGKIQKLQGMLDKMKPRDTTSYQTIETKQVTSVSLSKENPKTTSPLNVKALQKEMPVFNKLMDQAMEKQQMMAEKVQAVQGAFEQGFAAIGQSIVSGLGLAESGFEGFIGKLIETATQLIAIMLAQSIASSIAGATESAAATGPAAIFTQPTFLATMIGGVLAAFAAIPSFNLGGEVPGNSFFGDKMLIRANSGEEILRRDDPRHRNNFMGKSSQAQASRDRVIIPTVRIKKGDIYISYEEAKKEILKLT